MADNKAKWHPDIMYGGSFSGSDISIYCVLNPPNLGSFEYMKKAGELEQERSEIVEVIDDIKTQLKDTSTDWRQAQLKEQLRQNEEQLGSLNGNANSGNSNQPRFVELATASTLTYSLLSERRQVRAIGSSKVRGLTRGGVTIAGSLISVVFDRDIVTELVDHMLGSQYRRGITIDMLPPLDLFVFFSNEYGAVSQLVIYGAEFMNEGQVMSVQDMYTENTINYVARDISPMEPIRSSANTLALGNQPVFTEGLSASSLITNAYRSLLSIYQNG